MQWCNYVMVNIPIKQGFFNWAAMEFWAVETNKWAVGNLKLGSWKRNLLKNWKKWSIFNHIHESFAIGIGYFVGFHEISTELLGNKVFYG